MINLENIVLIFGVIAGFVTIVAFVLEVCLFRKIIYGVISTNNISYKHQDLAYYHIDKNQRINLSVAYIVIWNNKNIGISASDFTEGILVYCSSNTDIISARIIHKTNPRIQIDVTKCNTKSEVLVLPSFLNHKDGFIVKLFYTSPNLHTVMVKPSFRGYGIYNKMVNPFSFVPLGLMFILMFVSVILVLIILRYDVSEDVMRVGFSIYLVPYTIIIYLFIRNWIRSLTERMPIRLRNKLISCDAYHIHYIK